MRSILEEHPGKANCTSWKKETNTDVLETEKRMWLECEYSGQAQTWETAEAKKIWRKITERD